MNVEGSVHWGCKLFILLLKLINVLIRNDLKSYVYYVIKTDQSKNSHSKIGFKGKLPLAAK